MTPPKDPIGRIIQNALNLQRVSNALTQDSTDILRALFDELAADIARIDPTAPSAVRYRRDRVERLLERAAKLIADAMGDVHKGARQDLARLGRQQGEWAAQQLVVSLGPAGVRVAFRGPSVNTMKAILDVNPFQGETLRGWAKVQEAALLRRVRQQIQLGMANEESIDQLVRRVRGTSDGRGGFRGGVLEASTRDARALVRTAVTEVSNAAAFETYRANPKVTDAYEYVATLDSRTTLICIALSGQVFAYDDPKGKKPPQHWACRSIIVPVIDWEELGVEQPEGGTRAARNPKTGKTIQVPAETTYADWLRAAPRGVQDEVLGRGRADLWRAGKLDLRDLVRQDGRVLTLDELEAT